MTQPTQKAPLRIIDLPYGKSATFVVRSGGDVFGVTVGRSKFAAFRAFLWAHVDADCRAEWWKGYRAGTVTLVPVLWGRAVSVAQ